MRAIGSPTPPQARTPIVRSDIAASVTATTWASQGRLVPAGPKVSVFAQDPLPEQDR